MTTDWKPIETAPMDGRQILGFEPVSGVDAIDPCGWIGTVFYDTELASWMAEQLCDARHQYPNVFTATPCAPTHWISLPEPPRSDPDTCLDAWISSQGAGRP